MQNMEETVHNVTDLESCYYLKLENACIVVEEVVGVDRPAIKMFT